MNQITRHHTRPAAAISVATSEATDRRRQAAGRSGAGQRNNKSPSAWSRLVNVWTVSLVSVAMLVVVVVSYFWRIPPVSDDTYQLSAALFAACNLQDPQRLQAIEAVMVKLNDSPERERLADAVQAARTGQWQWAQRQAKSMMESRTE